MLVDARGRALPEVISSSPAGPRRNEAVTQLREAMQRPGEDLDGLLQTAMLYCDWASVHELASELRQTSPHCVDVYVSLGTACLHEGFFEEARRHAAMAMLCNPWAPEAQRIQCEVEHWEQQRRRFPLIPLHLRQRGALHLELLAPHHLADFLWQYDDPDIPRLCCLPHFASADEWLSWLGHEYSLTDQLTFATLHCDWGFVGVVSLVLHRNVGFVYYWVGQDFRGRGLASAGTSLLLDLAAVHWGMHTCYAKVFEENLPSIRVLEKLGFTRTRIQPIPDEAPELVLRRGIPTTRELETAELRQLLFDMNHPMRLPPTSAG